MNNISNKHENKNLDKDNEKIDLYVSKKLKRTICLIGCATLCGLRGVIVRKMAFAPPPIKGYLVENDKFIYNNIMNIEFNEILKKRNINIKFIPIKRYSNKIASILIYQKPLNLNKQIILFSHGNNTDIGYISPFLMNLVFFNNVNLIAYDYSGYGYSNKKPSEKNIYKNIKTVYIYITKELKVNPLNIIVYGYSIGTACSCYLISLTNIKIGGCILQSPLASGARLLIPSLIKKGLWFDVFKNVERLKKIPLLPIFIMHGKKDKQIPFNHSVCLINMLKENFQKRKNTNTFLNSETTKTIDNLSFIHFWQVENADHYNIEEKNTIDFYKKIKEFLSFCEKVNRDK